MRRSQTLASKHHARPSISTMAAHDELGAIRESESPEDTLRRQLVEKDQEIREVRTSLTVARSQNTIHSEDSICNSSMAGSTC